MNRKLLYEKKSAWHSYDENARKGLMAYAEAYKSFLDKAKTERFSVIELIKMAEANGFQLNNDKQFFIENSNKNLAIVKKGEKSALEGIKFIASHIDVPRIDLKQNPLYEKDGFVQLKTHYYGGIKKYHWLSRPLALYGIIFKKDGTRVEVRIGEKPDDPVLVISDLLPHLSAKQSKKSVSDAFEGEKLNVIFGSIPLNYKNNKEKNLIKMNILELLNNEYGIEEEDFLSAEIEVVPSENARDVGFDRGLVGAYGHDDRVCAYTSATAMFTSDNKRTVCALMFDKEEVGSNGKTGAQSRFIEDIVIEILKREGIEPTYTNIRTVMRNSELLSSDVSAGINPDYSDVHEKQNASIIGMGIALVKFTGSRGKASANDADAEFVFKVRSIFNEADVKWQTSELGKVDEGGGGTIAKFMAEYGMNVIDCGPPIIGMHSPFEIVSKADLYETHKGYKAFFESD